MNTSEEITPTKYARSLYKRLKEGVNWLIVRELILKYRQQKQAVFLNRKCNNQPKPKYYSTCGHLIPSFTIKQHTGFSIRCAVPRASRWAPVTLKALLDEETEWHYNNPILRPPTLADYRGGQVTQSWGRDEMEREWRQQAEPLSSLAKQLNDVAERLRSDEDLAILLKPRAPRLSQLSSRAGRTLGYVAYFFDCWQRFREYEQAAPAAMVLADAGAATLKTMRQVALLHIYQNATIPHAQASAIAEKYGFSSPTSGQKLYGIYNTLAHQTAARTGVASKGLRLMIADITAVLPHLTESGRQQAESELQTLEVRK